MERNLDTVHFEIPPNTEKLLYDKATEALKESCKGIAIGKITSIKYHPNSWGLSSNYAFAEEVVYKMKKLRDIDMSNKTNIKERTDLCMGI